MESGKQEVRIKAKAKYNFTADEVLGELADMDMAPDSDVRITTPNGGAWTPDLNPTQQKYFDDPSAFLLAHGEKGSGKTTSAGHKIVRHCYENHNALQLVMAPSIRTGVEGIWQSLNISILPHWKQGM